MKTLIRELQDQLDSIKIQLNSLHPPTHQKKKKYNSNTCPKNEQSLSSLRCVSLHNGKCITNALALTAFITLVSENFYLDLDLTFVQTVRY